MFCIKIVISGLLVLLLSAPCSKCTNYGSDSTPSRVAFTQISEAPNNILGFAGMYNGFFLAGATTAVSFQSYLPVGTTMILNGGTVSLSTDLFLDSELIIGSSGIITGNNFNVEFASHDQLISLPYLGLVNRLNNQAAGGADNTVDWSYDNKYLAVGTALQSGAGTELKIYSFDGLTLTLTASFNVELIVYQVGWQPVTPPPYYLVAGTSSGLHAYQFTPPSTLVPTSTVATGTAVYAVAWHPSGNKVAVGKNLASEEIAVYNFSAGTLSTNTGYNFSPDATVQQRALDFDFTGSYLAVGVSAANQLRVLYWNGTAITTTASANVGQIVNAVNWSPDGSLLAIGLTGGSNRLQIYGFDRSLNSLTSLPTYNVGETQQVDSVDWSPDSRVLASGRATGANFQLRLFAINPIAQRLLIAGEFTLGNSGNQVKWSSDGNYLAAADQSGNVSVFSFPTGTMTLSNANVVFNSPVQLRGPISFSGTSIIDCNGYTFDLNSQNFSLAAGASLLFKNVVLEGITGNNLYCLNSAGTISFKNVACVLNNNMTFTLGQLAIIGDCTMTGTGTFIYQSNQKSTISSGATWYFDRGMTFSYYPTGGSNNRINFADSTAQLYLYETALFAQSNGLQLTKGTVSIDGHCPFYSEATTQTGGILVGDGSSSANNVNIMILPESGIDVGSGYVVYQNVGS